MMFKNFVTRFSLALILIASVSAHAAGPGIQQIRPAGPDFVPDSIRTARNCSLNLRFSNRGSRPQQANEITMDHRFVLKGRFYVNGVLYKKRTAWYTDLVIPRMKPGVSFSFNAPHIRIAGPTQVVWTVNRHQAGGPGIHESNRNNNKMSRRINCRRFILN